MTLLLLVVALVCVLAYFYLASKPTIRVILSLLVVGLGCAFAYFYFAGRPPKEAKLIPDFQAHRPAYEKLREMLHTDKQLRRLADWGVETTTSPVPQKPPEGDFPLARYNEYLSLLKAVGGLWASRGEEYGVETDCVLVWASGWAGNTRHVDICWQEKQPSPLISSLDQYYQTPMPRHPAFRHIDGNWYLWADW